VDPSSIATASLEAAARDLDLPITVSNGSFEEIGPDRSYSAVLILGLIQLLPLEQIASLTALTTGWLAPGGIALITAFSTDDPAYPEVSDSWERLGTHSFQSPDGSIATYLEPDQVPSLFPELETVHHWHGLGPWHSHGNSEPERHGRIEAVLRKR
jgi:hypothetical protein